MRLPGQYIDAKSGLHYNFYRYYDASIGRYLSRDPIGQSGGMNEYAFAGADPINQVDPLGLKPCKSPSECASQVEYLKERLKEIKDDFRRYMPDNDGGGKEYTRKDGVVDITKPGGHYIELLGRLRGLLSNSQRYLDDCVTCEKDPPPPEDPLPDEVYDMCFKEVPKPIGLDPDQEQEVNKKLKDQRFPPGVLLPSTAVQKTILESFAAAGNAYLLAILFGLGSLAGI